MPFEIILIAGLGLLAGLLVWAAVSDGLRMIIPNWIPLSIFILFLAVQGLQWVLGVTPPILPFWSSLAVGGGALAVLTGLFALNWMGGGDVKLIAATAFWAGTEYIFDFLFVMALAGGILSLFFILKQRMALKNSQSKKVKSQTPANKKQRKTTYIPYGIAISSGGLFVVNQILTFLLA